MINQLGEYLPEPVLEKWQTKVATIHFGLSEDLEDMDETEAEMHKLASMAIGEFDED